MPRRLWLHARIGRRSLLLLSIALALVVPLFFLDWFAILRNIPVWFYWRTELVAVGWHRGGLRRERACGRRGHSGACFSVSGRKAPWPAAAEGRATAAAGHLGAACGTGGRGGGGRQGTPRIAHAGFAGCDGPCKSCRQFDRPLARADAKRGVAGPVSERSRRWQHRRCRTRRVECGRCALSAVAFDRCARPVATRAGNPAPEGAAQNPRTLR